MIYNNKPKLYLSYWEYIIIIIIVIIIYFNCKWVFTRWQWLYNKTQQTNNTLKLELKKLRGLSPQANYTDRATAAVGEVVPTFCG
jgi:hypothetical protein